MAGSSKPSRARPCAPSCRPLSTSPSAYVFGDEIGQRAGSVRRAWQTAVLRAHGQKPAWIWKKKTGPNDKGSTRLSRESEAAYRAINLHFHDLRHEGGSRLLEAGWLVHYVQHMLGHASLNRRNEKSCGRDELAAADPARRDSAIGAIPT